VQHFGSAMKLYLLTTTFLLSAFFSLGQTPEDEADVLNASGAYKMIFLESIQEIEALAHSDVKQGLLILHLQSGEAPVIFTTDSLFENEFDVIYYEHGCVAPKDKFMETYNFVVFDCLKGKYGKKWLKTVRKDIIGLKKWKRENVL